jgi:hypothetical protein
MKIWKLKEEVSPIDYIPLNRRIEWIARSILTDKGGRATTDDILSAVYTLIQNDPLTPEEKDIMDVLREIATPNKKNNLWFWTLKRARLATLDEYVREKPEKLPSGLEKEVELDHSRIIRAIAVLGLKFLRYNVWIGRPERAKTKDLNKVCNVTHLAAPVTQRTLERMQMVDVIWMRNSTVPISMFEAEAGDARRALLRMGDVLHEIPTTKAILVLADEKVNQINRIAKEPAIGEVIVGYDVFFTTYTSMVSLLRFCERGHSVDFRGVLQICKRMPIEVA